MKVGQNKKYQRSQPVTSARCPLVIVADDLTGACDAAVAFTPVCDSIRIHIDDAHSAVASVQATTTESRDLPVAEAEARIRSIAERLPPDAELFKKIDSVFRGNTIPEIAAILRHARYDLAILAPAYPALGRTVCKSVLQISDSAGDRTLAIAELLADADCSLTTLSADLSADELQAAFRNLLNTSKPAALCDTTDQEDLARIVGAARSLGKLVLWIGSGGLAHALAAELPSANLKSATYPAAGHTVLFIGTPHPVTRAQVKHWESATHSQTTDLLVPVILGETTHDEIRRTVAAYDPSQIGCLFMTGGDTAHFVCRALGIRALRLEREFAPGVPLAVAEGGPFDGVSVVLKSGGFGEPDLLCRLLETCRPEVSA